MFNRLFYDRGSSGAGDERGVVTTVQESMRSWSSESKPMLRYEANDVCSSTRIIAARGFFHSKSGDKVHVVFYYSSRAASA